MEKLCTEALEGLFRRLQEDPDEPATLNELARHAFDYARSALRRLRALKGGDRIDEAAQRVCVRILVQRRWEILRRGVRFVPYLTRAAKNEARSMLREERRFASLRRNSIARGADEEPTLEARRSADPSNLISALPENQRQIVALRLLRVPYVSIARQLGTTAGAARMRFARAKERMRSLLRKCPSAGPPVRPAGPGESDGSTNSPRARLPGGPS